jgi:predicted DNA-binding transcriptional regulator AlpA
MVPYGHIGVATNNKWKDDAVEDPLLSISDVAAMVPKMSENTLRWYRHVGRGPRSFKIGRRIFYRQSDVLAWIEEHYKQSVGAP